MQTNNNLECDYVIIGDGFGGSLSALRLAEKGYKVLVIENHLKSESIITNWNLRNGCGYKLGMRGLFKLTFYHILAIVSGVGVGGSSLVYVPIRFCLYPNQNFTTADIGKA
ncbi:MAG: hypothetical protein R2852_10045 [Bacteroidia bacterium]